MALNATVIPVTPFEQNCTLLRCDATNEGAVVDPGGDLDLILATAEKEGAQVKQILLTHAHIDHAGGTAELAQRLQLGACTPHHRQQATLFILKQTDDPIEPGDRSAGVREQGLFLL